VVWGFATATNLTSHHAKAAKIIAALTAAVSRLTAMTKATAKQLADGTLANRWTPIIQAIFEPLLKANAGPTQTIPG
jgi:hypothetical protein